MKWEGCRGSNNGQAKLTEESVLQILQLAHEGWKSERIAQKFRVHQAYVCRIVRRQSWKHIPWDKPYPYRPSTKLTVEQVKEIRRRSRLGEKRASLAREFGVTAANVSYIATGKGWKGV